MVATVLVRVGVSLAFAALMVGCGPTLQQIVPEEKRQKLLSFLEIGKSKKEDILARLGRPSGEFQGGRILTYRLAEVREEFSFHSEFKGLRSTKGKLGERWRRPSPPREVSGKEEVWGPLYNLVLIFDEANILERHNLIKMGY